MVKAKNVCDLTFHYFQINILSVIVHRYTVYALLKDSFGDKVRKLYTDTDSFFLHFFVDNLAKEINARTQLRDAFEFSDIEHTHLPQLRGPGVDGHGWEVGFFKDEAKGNPIVEFVGLRPKSTRSPYAAQPNTHKV